MSVLEFEGHWRAALQAFASLAHWRPVHRPHGKLGAGRQLLACWLESVRWPAWRLAQALQSFWQNKEVCPYPTLTAYAVGERRCAYLRCASLGVGRASCCSGCKASRYCSREHQVADWRAWHRAHCEYLKVLMKCVPPRRPNRQQEPPPQQPQQQQEQQEQRQQLQQTQQRQRPQQAHQPHWLRRKQQRRRR